MMGECGKGPRPRVGEALGEASGDGVGVTKSSSLAATSEVADADLDRVSGIFDV